MANTNPWDLTSQTGNVTGGLIQTQVTPVAPSTIPGTVTNADNTTFSAATPPVAAASGYTASQRTVDPSKETVAGQFAGLIQQGSPLIDMGRTSANQQMNARGLLNSSLASTASDVAAYQAALPIASADAQIYTNVADKNLSAQNEALKTNAAATNDIAKSNLGAAVDTLKSNMDSAVKNQLATIEADYKTTMQNSATASEMYKQTVKNISDIFTNKDMTAAAKNTAIDNQLYMLKQGFELAGAIGNMNLGSLLDFSDAPKAA